MVGVESTKGRFRNYNTFSVIVNSASALSNKTLSPINSSRNFHHNQTGNHIKLLLIEKKKNCKIQIITHTSKFYLISEGSKSVLDQNNVKPAVQ